MKLSTAFLIGILTGIFGGPIGIVIAVVLIVSAINSLEINTVTKSAPQERPSRLLEEAEYIVENKFNEIKQI